MLKIVRETDVVEVKQIAMMVYGQPGIGKTSLAQTAEAPLTLDFDAGIHRSAFRKDAVLVQDWAEVASLSREDLADYQTVVVDTGGRALDKLTSHIIRANPKLAASSGALTLQGYGELKAVFATWLKMLRELGKDVVILAHDSEDKQGDELIMRPDITGGSKQELIKVADCLGYLYQTRKGAVLDFNATDRWIGKNCAGFDPLPVPNFANDPKFLAGVIERTKDALNQQTEEQKKALAELEQWRADIEAIDSVEALTALIPLIADSDHKTALRSMIWRHAKAQGWDYDKEQGRFFETEHARPDSFPPEEAQGAADSDAGDQGAQQGDTTE